MNMVKIINDNDRIWAVELTTNDDGEYLVGFYDTRYEFKPLGQFVSRYYASTIVEVTHGLNLHGGTPEWSISHAGMDRVKDWLSSVLNIEA